MTARDIAGKFSISKPSISHHLDLLKQAQLCTYGIAYTACFYWFVGNSLDKIHYKRGRLGCMYQRMEGARPAIQMVLYDQNDGHHSSKLSDYVVDELNKALGLELHLPEFIEKDKEMFD